MKRSTLMIPVIALLVTGCELLPSGTPPAGNIISEPETAGMTKLIFDRRGALDYFINELIRETMLHCAGETIFIDADRDSLTAANYIVSKAGEFSNIKPGSKQLEHPRLISRRSGGEQWEMELISASGKSLWKRKVSVRN